MPAIRRPRPQSQAGHKDRGPLRLVVAALVAITGSAAIIAAVAGGGADGNGVAVAQQVNDRPIVVTRAGNHPNPMCRPKRIGIRLENFSHALRTVDEDALRRFIGWPGFRAFGVSRRNGKRILWADSYETALRQLRRKGGLRLRFHEVATIGNGGSFRGAFRTGKGKKWRQFGKAGWSCKRQGIIQMGVVLGTRQTGSECPKPRRKVPRKAMIVCSR